MSACRLPAILAAWLLWTGRLLLRLRQWHQSEGGPLPVPSRLSAGAAAWLCLLCRIWGIVVVLCFLIDVGHRMQMGSALGLLLGGCIGLYFNRNRKDKEGRKLLNSKGTVVFYALVLLSATILAPIFSPLSDVLMPAPALNGETFVPGAARVNRSFPRSVSYANTDTSSIGSFGLRYQSWWEDTGEADPNDDPVYLIRESWTHGGRLSGGVLHRPLGMAVFAYTGTKLREVVPPGGGLLGRVDEGGPLEQRPNRIRTSAPLRAHGGDDGHPFRPYPS